MISRLAVYLKTNEFNKCCEFLLFYIFVIFIYYFNKNKLCIKSLSMRLSFIGHQRIVHLILFVLCKIIKLIFDKLGLI